nr:large conductance mechanosensitive channel protein MscL [Actinomycetospora endophytica]
MLRGFKDFLLRGNVVDLSVAVVVGAAFTAVVAAFTNAFLKPLIQLVSPSGGQFAGTLEVNGVVFDYASFLNQIITFFLTAAVVYFAIVAPMKAIQNRRLRGEESGPAESTDIELLTEIRDLLAATQVGSGEVSPAKAVAAQPDGVAVPAAVASSTGATSRHAGDAEAPLPGQDAQQAPVDATRRARPSSGADHDEPTRPLPRELQAVSADSPPGPAPYPAAWPRLSNGRGPGRRS